MNILLKRAYDNPSSNDGYRILVDRLWPRGIKKETLKLDEWCKDLAPSSELRTWFHHDPNKFGEFKKRYQQELKDNPKVATFAESIKNKSTVTFIYSAKDTERNQAVVLKDYVRRLL